MDAHGGASQAIDDGLRARKLGRSQDSPAPPVANGKDGEQKDRKTYGRTPDGTTFVVPQTHDMVSQLFSPSQPKNVSDVLVVVILGLHILFMYLLKPSYRIPVFAITFTFWRTCYNAGIGYLLHVQSNHRRLVAWARQSHIFEDPSKGRNSQPILYGIIKREMQTKIPEDYDFDKVPVEYNTWLVFRRVVDVILLCDFVSYCLFAVACMGRPQGEGPLITALRWSFGVGLFFFNLWVKLDAHRVVKDYAWYWGDFFFLIDQELTFDGVFEMAPHPMYSIGYAGYYGISLMAASYRVLIISIIAHAAQFAFLICVENPHIDKTYNSPPPRKPRAAVEERDIDSESAESSQLLPTPSNNDSEMMSATPPATVHNLIGIKNTDFHRVTDTSVLLLLSYFCAFTLLTPSTPFYQTFFAVNAALWRIWYSMGIGFILNRQSTKRRWTRHFLKYGGSVEEAWREWKGIYHLSMTFCYASFVAAAWKMYDLPPNWTQGFPVLKHVIGCGLIALHIWTSMSIYDSLGEFGWFFGDFFYPDQQPKLNYSGIYRYLNNPERFIGLAGVWGATLITRSAVIFSLALLSHALTLMFLEFVERPHMQKLYGRNLREESGLTKSLKRSLPSQLIQLQGSVDRMLEDTFDSVEDLVDAAKPKIAAGVNLIVRDSTQMFKHPTRISISRLSPDLAGFDPKDYSLELVSSAKNGKGSSDAPKSDQKSNILEYGAPIRVRWTAPLNHSKKDWIGLYKVADNHARDTTHVRSHGRWIATNKDQFGSFVADHGILVSDARVSGSKRRDGEDKDYLSGKVEFSGDKLFWTTGVFEFRYHHNRRYNVMAISIPFETKLSKFDEDEIVPTQPDRSTTNFIQAAVEQDILRLVGNCFDRDPDIAPATVDESFGGLVEKNGKYAGRVVYAVHQMFGIEFAPEVVQADGNVRNLAWRVRNARKVLVRETLAASNVSC